jgi:peroxiredoxin
VTGAVSGPAPDFSLPDGVGRIRSLVEFRGRPLVLTFLRGFL